MFQAKKAERSQLKLMIGLEGPAGSGKTYGALEIARGLAGSWDKVLVVDTENGSASYYADDRRDGFLHVNYTPDVMPDGYDPRNWVKLLEWIAKEHPSVEAVVLDSITHEWEGTGGCLELAEKSQRGGNSFTGWKVVTPLHRAFIDKMRHSPFHVVATMRSKTDYVLEQNSKGKTAPKKVGTKSVQREGTDYEFGVIFTVDINHYATATKDRTNSYGDRAPFKISQKTGEELLAWASSGKAIEPEQAAPVATKPKSEPVPERYDGTPAAKRKAAEIFKEFGLTDATKWAEYGDNLIGCDWNEVVLKVKAQANA